MRKILATMATLLALITLLTFNSCDITSPTDPIIKNPNDTVTVVTKTDAEVDSLIKVLIFRAEQLETVESAEEVKSIEFKALSDIFAGIVKGDNDNYKANVGLIVSSVLALNSSSTLQKLADSLDSYFSDMDDFFSSSSVTVSGNSTRNSSKRVVSQNMASSVFKRKGTRNLYSKAAKKDGINGLGLTLLATMPEIIVSRAELPKIPKFITVAYIQTAIENEINPILDNIINSFDNIETLSDTTNMKFVVDSENVELDMADIYLTDASVRALRAGLAIFNAYDWDMFTSASDQSYSWVDDILQMENDFNGHSINNLSLSGDTIINDNYYSVDTALYQKIYDVVNYNYNNRSSFLTIRKANHAAAYADLKAVPTKLSKALELLDAETDNQEDDLIKKVDISDIQSDMVNIKSDMLDEGISEAFASNFDTPQKLIDFTEKILTEPYTFEETIDSTNLKIKVDISKFFTNPVKDFRDWVPLHKFRSKSNIIEFQNSNDDYVQQQTSIWLESDAEINKGTADSVIDSISTDNTVYLKNSYYYKDNYSWEYPAFIDFLDDKGNTITMSDMLDSLENGKIAYFKDYTLNGIFPEMTTRAKWNDFIAKIIDLSTTTTETIDGMTR